MSAKFPCVSKRPIVPGIIDLPNFNDKDLEEIFGGGQGLFGVTYIRTALTPFSIQVFSSHDDKERNRKRGGHYKTAAKKNTFKFFFLLQ